MGNCAVCLDSSWHEERQLELFAATTSSSSSVDAAAATVAATSKLSLVENEGEDDHSTSPLSIPSAVLSKSVILENSSGFSRKTSILSTAPSTSASEGNGEEGDHSVSPSSSFAPSTFPGHPPAPALLPPISTNNSKEDEIFPAAVSFPSSAPLPTSSFYSAEDKNRHMSSSPSFSSDESSEAFQSNNDKIESSSSSSSSLSSELPPPPTVPACPVEEVKELEDRPLTVLLGGATYKGQWYKERMNGKGSLHRPDGSYYEGEFKDNRADGHGKFKHTCGDTYEGEWKDDQAHGFGIFTHSDGSSYKGQWKADLQDGYGVEKWSDESSFEGYYVDSKKEGYGKFRWAEGSMYEGQFEDNEIHGEGTYLWFDGRKYSGQWRKNHMHGIGKMKWLDGRVYSGRYDNDKKHGEGCFTWPDGRKYEGQWSDGKQHGIGIYQNSKGIRRQGEWKKGKRIAWTDQNSTNTKSLVNTDSSEYSGSGGSTGIDEATGAAAVTAAAMIEEEDEEELRKVVKTTSTTFSRQKREIEEMNEKEKEENNSSNSSFISSSSSTAVKKKTDIITSPSSSSSHVEKNSIYNKSEVENLLRVTTPSSVDNSGPTHTKDIAEVGGGAPTLLIRNPRVNNMVLNEQHSHAVNSEELEDPHRSMPMVRGRKGGEGEHKGDAQLLQQPRDRLSKSTSSSSVPPSKTSGGDSDMTFTKKSFAQKLFGKKAAWPKM